MPKSVPTCDLCKSRPTREVMSLLCDTCADMVQRIVNISNGLYRGYTTEPRAVPQKAGH